MTGPRSQKASTIIAELAAGLDHELFAEYTALLTEIEEASALVLLELESQLVNYEDLTKLQESCIDAIASRATMTTVDHEVFQAQPLRFWSKLFHKSEECHAKTIRDKDEQLAAALERIALLERTQTVNATEQKFGLLQENLESEIDRHIECERFLVKQLQTMFSEAERKSKLSSSKGFWRRK